MKRLLFGHLPENTKWLKSCIISIWDRHEHVCFDTRRCDDASDNGELSLEEVTCEDGGALTAQDTIYLRGKPYKVYGIDLYTGMFEPNSYQRTEGVNLQVVIILDTNFYNDPF